MAEYKEEDYEEFYKKKINYEDIRQKGREGYITTNGNTSLYSTLLDSIYNELKELLKISDSEKSHLKSKYEGDISNLKHSNLLENETIESIENKIVQKRQEISKKRTELNELKISDLEKNPNDKLNYNIHLIFIYGIGFFLFLLYANITFGAFGPPSLNTSLLGGNVFADALNDDPLTFLYTILLPLLPLGLAYIAEVNSKNKNFISKNNLILFSVVLLFDSFMAYKVALNKYSADPLNPPWEPSFAVKDDIFITAIVLVTGIYILWGYFLSGYFKLNEKLQPNAILLFRTNEINTTLEEIEKNIVELINNQNTSRTKINENNNNVKKRENWLSLINQNLWIDFESIKTCISEFSIGYMDVCTTMNPGNPAKINTDKNDIDKQSEYWLQTKKEFYNSKL
jgi:hypothetical protein